MELITLHAGFVFIVALVTILSVVAIGVYRHGGIAASAIICGTIFACMLWGVAYIGVIEDISKYLFGGHR